MPVRLLLPVVVVVALLAVVVGPLAFATVTARPFVMHCEDLTTATCDEALTYWSADFEDRNVSDGPMVGFWFKSTSGGTCGDVFVTYWTLFGPGFFAQPFC